MARTESPAPFSLPSRLGSSTRPSEGLPIGKNTFIHPSAIVEDAARVGEGTSVWHFCHVMAGARIGRDCTLGQNTFVGATAVVGDRVKIQNNVSVYDGVVLEDEVFCGPSCVFTNVKNPRSLVDRKEQFARTVVGRGATLGANATVLPGVRIGAYALVGAGAVVTRDVPSYRIVLGSPARSVGYACRCGESLSVEVGSESRPPLADGIEVLFCGRCPSRYRLSDGSVEPMIEESP